MFYIREILRLTAVNYYHKELHLECCHRPRSASEISVKISLNGGVIFLESFLNVHDIYLWLEPLRHLKKTKQKEGIFLMMVLFISHKGCTILLHVVQKLVRVDFYRLAPVLLCREERFWFKFFRALCNTSIKSFWCFYC